MEEGDEGGHAGAGEELWVNFILRRGGVKEKLMMHGLSSSILRP